MYIIYFAYTFEFKFSMFVLEIKSFTILTNNNNSNLPTLQSINWKYHIYIILMGVYQLRLKLTFHIPTTLYHFRVDVEITL